MKVFTHNLRFKDRGIISASYFRDRNDDGKDCLELSYSDNNKDFRWNYYWDNSDAYCIDKFKEMQYDVLKENFLKHQEDHGYEFEDGEYQLMKNSIIIFISHLELYIIELEKASRLGVSNLYIESS